MRKKILIVILIIFITAFIGMTAYFIIDKNKINYIYDPSHDEIIFSLENIKKDYYQYDFEEKGVSFNIYKKNNSGYVKINIDEYPQFGLEQKLSWPDYCLKDACRVFNYKDYLWGGWAPAKSCRKLNNSELFFKWDLREDFYKQVECKSGMNNCYNGRKRTSPGIYKAEVCVYDVCEHMDTDPYQILGKEKCFYNEFVVPGLNKLALEMSSKLEKVKLCKRLYGEWDGNIRSEELDKIECKCDDNLYCDCEISNNEIEQMLLTYNKDMDTCLYLESYYLDTIYSVDIYNITKRSNSPHSIINYGEFIESKSFDENCEELFVHYTINQGEEIKGGCNALNLRSEMFATVRKLGFDINENIAYLEKIEPPKKEKKTNEKMRNYSYYAYGLHMKYPDFFSKTSNFADRRLEVISDKADWLTINIEEGGLDGYVYYNQSGSFNFRYSSSTDKWISTQEGVSADLAPHKINMGVANLEKNLEFYLVSKSDVGSEGELAIIENPEKNYIIEIEVSRNNTIDHYSNQRTIYEIINTIDF